MGYQQKAAPQVHFAQKPSPVLAKGSAAGILYGISDNLGLKKLHGKSLSYNNYKDIYSSLSILKSLKKPLSLYP